MASSKREEQEEDIGLHWKRTFAKQRYKMSTRDVINALFTRLNELYDKMDGSPYKKTRVLAPLDSYKIAEFWVINQPTWPRKVLDTKSFSSTFKYLHAQNPKRKPEFTRMVWLFALSLGIMPKKGCTALDLRNGKCSNLYLPTDMPILEWTSPWFRYPAGIAEPPRILGQYIRISIEIAFELNPYRKTLGGDWYPAPDNTGMVYWKAYKQANQYSLIFGDLMLKATMPGMPENLARRIKINKYYHLGIGESPLDEDPKHAEEMKSAREEMLETAVAASTQIEAISNTAALSAYEDALRDSTLRLNEQNDELIKAKVKVEELAKQLLAVGAALEECRKEAVEKKDRATEVALEEQQQNLADVLSDAMVISNNVAKAMEDNDEATTELNIESIEEESLERKSETRQNLLEQIRKGNFKLKKVPQETAEQAKQSGTLVDAITKAMEERRSKMNISPEEEEAEEGEGEWDYEAERLAQSLAWLDMPYYFIPQHSQYRYKKAPAKAKTKRHTAKNLPNPFEITFVESKKPVDYITFRFREL